MFQATKLKRYAFFLSFDIVISIISVVLSYFLRFNGDIPNEFYKGLLLSATLITIIKILALWFLQIYKVPWRFFGLYEARKIFVAIFIANFIFTIIYLFLDEIFEPFPRSVIAIDFILSFLLISGLRISKRMFLDTRANFDRNTPCLVIGATSKAIHVLKGMKQGYINYYAVSVVDERDSLIGTYCENFVVRPKSYIPQAIKKYGVNTAIVALKLEPDELKELFDELSGYGIKNIKTFSLIGDDDIKIKDISIEDLLARKPKDLDNSVVEKFVSGKVVMITGAGGTIGSELCKQCLKFGAKELIMVEHSEFNLYTINEATKSDPRNRLVMLNIMHKKEFDEVFAKYRPEIVIHAAAYKHVPLCEYNPVSAVQNNIYGTKNVIDLSIKYGVKRVLLISTDKAVRPTNIMGTTKRVCELYALNSNNISENTDIVAVRFGNVLGSSGSVIPKFKAQIAANEPLSVTHPEITRYFMLVSEACQLVLQATSIAQGGELFVLDMGKPVKIADLATRMLQLSNKEHLGINYIGLRPGEKLYEELLIDKDDVATKYESIFVTHSGAYDIDLLNLQIAELMDCEDESEIAEKLKAIVPEFNHFKG